MKDSNFDLSLKWLQGFCLPVVGSHFKMEIFEPVLHTAQKKLLMRMRGVLVPGAWAPPVLYDDAEAEFR